MFASLFGKKRPSYAGKDRFFSLTKGYNLSLEGDVDDSTIHPSSITRYAVRPIDYRGMSPIPKVMVNVGDYVKAGEPLFYDKKRPEIFYAAPVSGELLEVRRGPKRAIHELIILADKDITYKEYNAPSLDDRDQVVSFLLESGAWALLNQRPYDIIPAYDAVPRDIFVSTFSTAPLAPDYNTIVKGKEAYFSKGLEVLKSLTSGDVYLGLDGNGTQPADVFAKAEGVKRNYFAGKHPVGNVGVQIHHTAPIAGGESVWTIGVQDVITLGGLFVDGIYDARRIVKLAGAQMAEPKYVSTYKGAHLGELVGENIQNENVRMIAGDVYTGDKVESEDFLRADTEIITAIKEGDEHEFMGWLLPIRSRPSLSPTFLSSHLPGMTYEGTTNTRGERRAFVATGQYESVLPMDIYPQHLMKAILANDFEQMEGLGIYELSEEDIAVCEFVCTSKMPLQKILRQGLDTVREQS